MKDIYQWVSDDGVYAEYALDSTYFNSRDLESINNLGNLSALNNEDLEHLISVIDHGVSVHIHGGDKVKDYILDQAEKLLMS